VTVLTLVPDFPSLETLVTCSKTVSLQDAALQQSE